MKKRKSWRRLRPKDRRYYDRYIKGPERRDKARRKSKIERRDGYDGDKK